MNSCYLLDDSVGNFILASWEKPRVTNLSASFLLFLFLLFFFFAFSVFSILRDFATHLLLLARNIKILFFEIGFLFGYNIVWVRAPRGAALSTVLHFFVLSINTGNSTQQKQQEDCVVFSRSVFAQKQRLND